MIPRLKWTHNLWIKHRILTIFAISLVAIFHSSFCHYDIQPTESDICPTEGFFPDPRSCTKFYRCVESFQYFYAYEFRCPKGTVFDPDAQVCNHPYAVRIDYRCHINNKVPKVCHQYYPSFILPTCIKVRNRYA